MAEKSIKSPKKLLVVRNAFAYDFGGAERLAVHLAQEVNALGIASVIVSRQQSLLAYAAAKGVPAKRGWWWANQDWSGKKVTLFPVYFAWQVTLFFWYLQLIARSKVDVVHVMSKDDFISATLAAKVFHKKVVWTDPADLKHVFRNHRVWFKNPVGKLVYLASKLADSVTLVSNSEKLLIEESLGKSVPNNFSVVHIAGKDELVAPLVRATKDKEAVVFCSTSRLVTAKGIKELVQAFNIISKSSDKYRLWLVGDGPDQQKFEKAAENNPHISFVGHSDKPLEYVAACDVFVHPTHHEGFSLSLAEAAMLGKPMIASDVGGNPELVNDKNGVLFPVHDVTALKDAMLRLAESKDLRIKLGARARHDYKTNFDFITVIKNKIVPLYEK